jgi:3'-5' exoribonuclease
MRRPIRDLKEKDHFQSTYLALAKNVGQDRNGKVFLSLTLADATGQINARMFEKVETVRDLFDSGDVVWVKGFVQVFQNRKQVIVHEVRKALEGEYQMPELVASLGRDPHELWKELIGCVEGLKDPFVRGLLAATLNDESVKAALLTAPAAKTIHHAYRGGLIEHIHSILGLMRAMAQHYDFLNFDLLAFGAIYHDIGKIGELDVSDGIHYTRTGRLVGHMTMACEMVDRFAAGVDGFPDEMRDVLKHIVLSHHGKLEYGSPKLPMLPEALVVAMIDDLDSKMNTLFHFLKGEADSVPPEEKWSHYHSGFERYFYLDIFRKRINELK